MSTTTTKRDPIKWDLADIKAATSVIRAINHRFRRNIVEHLHQKNKPTSVTDIYIAMRTDQSTCSQHLAILRKAGIVNGKRKSKNVFYTVNYEVVGRAQETMKLFAV